MHHLDVMTGPAGSNPFAAWDVIVWADLGGNGLEDGFDMGPGLFGAARHDARAEPRPFLAAGDAGAHVEDGLLLQLLYTLFGIQVVGVAAVNDDIARL